MSAVIESVSNHVEDDDTRQSIYVDLIEAFEDQDWDTQDECKGEDAAFDAAIRELHPGWDWEVEVGLDGDDESDDD